MKIGPWKLTKDILRNEGIKGMFRGLTPTFAREMPGYFFFFGGYELCRHLVTPVGKSKEEIGIPPFSINRDTQVSFHEYRIESQGR